MVVRAPIAIAVCAVLLSVGCHNTWQGVKKDTRHALQKTGAGLKKAGQKLETSVKK
jgi:predicted small secreted protein